MCDVAFDAGSEEISTQLAELEARELTQIEKAGPIKQGTYAFAKCARRNSSRQAQCLALQHNLRSLSAEMELYPG